MSDDGCQSCEVPAKVCLRLRSVRAEACCTQCAMDAPGVLHMRLTPSDTLRDDLVHIAEWCRGIARKADAQGNDALAATAPRIAEEIDRALAGTALAYARYEPNAAAEEVLTWLRANGRIA